MTLATFNMRQGPAIEVRLNRLTFTGQHGMRGSVPAPLTQDDASLAESIAGLADLLGAITIQCDLVAGELLLLPVDFPLHKAEIALRVEAGANMFRRLTVDIEFDKRQLIALPAIFTGRGIPVTPRAESGEKMDFIT